MRIHRISTKNLFVTGISLFVFACLFTYIIFFLTDTFRDYEHKETTGIIVDYEERWNPSTETNKYYPIISYEVDDNQYKTYGRSQDSMGDIGKSVTIEYNINNPKDARLDSDKADTASKVAIIIIDVVMLLGSMALIVCGIKRIKEDKQG